MGQKSRSKKNKKPEIVSNKSSQAPDQAMGRVVPKAVAPASLNGGKRPTSVMQVQSAYIREDIVRILLLLGAVAVVLGGLYALSSTTPYLQDAGREMGKFLKLQ